MLTVPLLVVILLFVMATNVHNVLTLFFVTVIHAVSVSSIVAFVMVIYVTDVRNLAVIMHVRLQTVLRLVSVL